MYTSEPESCDEVEELARDSEDSPFTRLSYLARRVVRSKRNDRYGRSSLRSVCDPDEFAVRPEERGESS